ncbi:MAG: DUF2442 domain-containing protein [Bacteroidota bacterium]
MIAVKKVWFDHDKIFVELNDARIIGTPISWYPNLSKGTPDQLKQFELWENGKWIHWEDLDEDLSAEGFLTFDKESLELTHSEKIK